MAEIVCEQLLSDHLVQTAFYLVARRPKQINHKLICELHLFGVVNSYFLLLKSSRERSATPSVHDKIKRTTTFG